MVPMFALVAVQWATVPKSTRKWIGRSINPTASHIELFVVKATLAST